MRNLDIPEDTAMKTHILSLTLMVSFLLFLSSTAQAGGHIDPSGFIATASSAHATFYGPEFAINGAGLIGGTFPSELHHGGHIRGHSNSAEQIWLSLEPSDDAPNGTWFKVDLGQSYALEEVVVFNGSFRGGNSGLGTTDSLKQGDIYYSNSANDPGDDFSAAGWTLFGTAGAREFAQLINGGGDFGPTETIPLGFTAQWFAIDVNTNYGAADWTALAELQFIEGEAIPEPGTFAIAALGLLGLMGIRRRRIR
jgi:hypothetical protein